MTTGYARRFRIGMGAGLLVITAVAFLRPPLLPEIGTDLGLSALGLGALGSAFGLGRLTADFPAGALTDRSRPGAMMATAAATVAVGSLAFGLAPGPVLAFVAAYGLGIGSTWTMTTSLSFFARAPRLSRGTSLSYFAAALLVGQAIGPAIGGALAALWDWRVALVLGAAAAVALVPLFLRYPGERPPPAAAGRPAAHLPPRRILAVVYLLPAVQFSIGAAVVQTLVPIVGDEELALGPAVVGLALGLGGVARLVGAVISGRVSDLVGRKWALIPGLTMQVVGLAVFALMSSGAAWWLAILALALGSVAVNVGGTVLADLSEHGGLGRQLGAFRFTGDLALLVAPILAGALYDVGGKGLATLPILVLAAGTTVAAAVVLPETLHR